MTGLLYTIITSFDRFNIRIVQIARCWTIDRLKFIV